MLRLVLCCGLALGVGALSALASDKPDESAPARPDPASQTSPSQTAPTNTTPDDKPKSAPAERPAPEARPAGDPTLIEVPSNTLGPGLPLWVRRDHEAASARIARAEADYAEARAAQAQVEARRAADDQYYYDPYYGVVVYGPHRPGLNGALRARPVPHASRHRDEEIASRGVPTDNDPFDAAQRSFYETSRPRIGPIIERQLEAQRRFGENATPPIADIQRGIDNAVINARRGAPLPQDANSRREAPAQRPQRPKR